MAEAMQEEKKPERSLLQQTGDVIRAVYRGLTRDGTIDAFLRQGANEIGAALVAFPTNSIQVDEPGAVFNPLYSDISADKRNQQHEPRQTAANTQTPPGETSQSPSPGDASVKPEASVYGEQQAPLTPGEIAASVRQSTVHGANDAPTLSPGEIASMKPGSVYGEAANERLPTPGEIAQQDSSQPNVYEAQEQKQGHHVSI